MDTTTLAPPPKTIAEGLVTRLREDILQCRLRPGDRLRLDVLRETYSVGMSPLREALSRLSSMGLVTAEGQRGFSVAQISIADLMGLTKTRVWIEVLALRFAIATGDRNWEAEILAAAHRLSGCPLYIFDSGTRTVNMAWRGYHRAFHAKLVSVATSPHVLQFREHLFDLSERYRRISGSFLVNERDIAGEHEALTAATLARDATLASERMTDHLINTTALIVRNHPDEQSNADRLIARLRADIKAGMDN